MFSLGSALGVEVVEGNLLLASVRKGFKQFDLQENVVIENFRDLSPVELRDRIFRSFTANSSLRDHVVLGIPRDEAVVRWVELPLDVEENLEQVVRFQVERLEPTEEGGSYFESQVVERNETEGKLLLQISMLPKPILNGYLDILQQVDLYPTAIRLSSIAYHQILLAHSDGIPKEQPCLVLSLNPGLLEMILISGPQKCFSEKIQLQENEELTVSVALRYAHAFLSQFNPSGSDIHKIYLSGAIADSLLEEFHSRISDCELLRMNLQLGGKNLPSALLEQFLPAAGMAISSVSKLGTSRSNLIPKEKRLVLERSNLLPTFLLAGLLLVMGFALVGRGYFQRTQLLHQIETQLSALGPSIQEVMTLRESTQRAEAQLAELEKLMQGRQKTLGILRELTEKLPDKSFLNSLTIQGNRVNIMGYSDSASALLPGLLESEYFDTVESRYITPDKSMGNREKFHFEATAK